MTYLIDLKELEVELSRTRDSVESWAKQKTEFAAHTRDSHMGAMQDQAGELAACMAISAVMCMHSFICSLPPKSTSQPSLAACNRSKQTLAYLHSM